MAWSITIRTDNPNDVIDLTRKLSCALDVDPKSLHLEAYYAEFGAMRISMHGGVADEAMYNQDHIDDAISRWDATDFSALPPRKSNRMKRAHDDC